MANYTIVDNCIQGIPNFLTLNGSTVVPLASSITNRQVGVYHYKDAVVSDTLIGDASVVTAFLARNSIR